jgi:hypothetical protein
MVIKKSTVVLVASGRMAIASNLLRCLKRKYSGALFSLLSFAEPSLVITRFFGSHLATEAIYHRQHKVDGNKWCPGQDSNLRP